MKRNTKSILTILLVFALMAGCSKKDDVSPDTAATNALKGSWDTHSGYVKVDGTDVTSEYSNFNITFSTTDTGQKIYTVQNGSHAFNNITADTYTFEGNTFTQVKRGSDGVVMTYVIQDNILSLSFAIPDPGPDGGRVKGLFGNFAMSLKKM